VSRSDRFTALRGFAALLAVALLSALLAAACNGDGDDKTPAAGETPAANETPTADSGDDGNGDGGSGGGLSELEALAAEASGDITAKVTYKVTTDVDGVSTVQEWVLAQRPPDFRFEIAYEDGGEEFRTIIISAGGKNYMCTSTLGEETCLATEADEAQEGAALLDLLSDIPQELTEDAEDADLVDTSHRTIAGVDAACFTVRNGLSDLGEGEICFSDEGLLLYMRSEVDGATSLFEATSVSTDVTDADFEPPYDILEIPDLEGLEDFDLEDLEGLEFPEQ
jgi:hypothetical protein